MTKPIKEIYKIAGIQSISQIVDKLIRASYCVNNKKNYLDDMQISTRFKRLTGQKPNFQQSTPDQ